MQPQTLAQTPITLQLDAKTVDYIWTCLAARPWAEANPTMVNISQQVQAQQGPGPVSNGEGQPDPWVAVPRPS